MPKIAKQLSAIVVARLTRGLHTVGGVPGLYLKVTETSSRSWVLRVVVAGRRSDMGLGSYPAVGLAEARDEAMARRKAVSRGVDPLQAKRTAKAALKAEIDFKASALAYIASKEPEWKNIKHGEQWRNTLETYAYPVIGALLPRQVETSHVLAILEPIWTIKTETASRVRNRIELVLDWSGARGRRDGLNPARWRGHLDKLLPAPTKVSKVKHHEALAIDDAPAFMARLRGQPGAGARALEFAILTAARSGEVRGATWSEVDLDSAMWKIPAERMKAKRDHRVPLPTQALALLRALPRMAGDNLLFTSTRAKSALSDATLLAVLKRMEVPATPHGFRSTFRDWAAERTNYPSEMAEMALAHVVGDKVEAAYRRGDLLDKRRQFMEEWAGFLGAR